MQRRRSLHLHHESEGSGGACDSKVPSCNGWTRSPEVFPAGANGPKTITFLLIGAAVSSKLQSSVGGIRSVDICRCCNTNQGYASDAGDIHGGNRLDAITRSSIPDCSPFDKLVVQDSCHRGSANEQEGVVRISGRSRRAYCEQPRAACAALASTAPSQHTCA